MGMLALDNVDAVLNGRPAPTRSDTSVCFKEVSQSMSPRLSYYNFGRASKNYGSI
jgi:hypothetical protein